MIKWFNHKKIIYSSKLFVFSIHFINTSNFENISNFDAKQIDINFLNQCPLLTTLLVWNAHTTWSHLSFFGLQCSQASIEGYPKIDVVFSRRNQCPRFGGSVIFNQFLFWRCAMAFLTFSKNRLQDDTQHFWNEMDSKLSEKWMTKFETSIKIESQR